MGDLQEYRNFDDPIEVAHRIVQGFRSFRDQYDRAYEAINRSDHELQDLLHEIEMLDLSEGAALETFNALRQNRVERREAKQLMQVGKPLYDLVRRNHKVIAELDTVLRSMQNIESRMRFSIYSPRIRKEKLDAFINLTARASGKTPEEIRTMLAEIGEVDDDETDDAANG